MNPARSDRPALPARPARWLLSAVALGLAAAPLSADDEVGKGNAKESALRTFNMEDFGGGPDGNEQARKLVKKHFTAAFPNGLRIGKDKDKKGLHSYRVESADELWKLLPLRGDPGVLGDDSKDGLKKAGGLAGQLITTKLNLAFDGLGVMGDTKDGGATPLSAMVLQGKVAKKLRGLTVLELVQVADKAVAGKYGDEPKSTDKVVDVDDDGKPDVTLRAIREALNLVNNSHQRGDEMWKVLTDPGKGAVAAQDTPAEELGEEEDGGLSPQQEAAIERLEAARDRELQALDEELRPQFERAREADDTEKMREIAQKHREKRIEIERRFEQNQDRLEAQWRERREAKRQAELERGEKGKPELEKGPVKKGNVRGRAGEIEPIPPKPAPPKKGKDDGEG